MASSSIVLSPSGASLQDLMKKRNKLAADIALADAYWESIENQKSEADRNFKAISEENSLVPDRQDRLNQLSLIREKLDEEIAKVKKNRAILWQSYELNKSQRLALASTFGPATTGVVSNIALMRAALEAEAKKTKKTLSGFQVSSIKPSWYIFNGNENYCLALRKKPTTKEDFLSIARSIEGEKMYINVRHRAQFVRAIRKMVAEEMAPKRTEEKKENEVPKTEIKTNPRELRAEDSVITSPRSISSSGLLLRAKERPSLVKTLEVMRATNPEETHVENPEMAALTTERARLKLELEPVLSPKSLLLVKKISPQRPPKGMFEQVVSPRMARLRAVEERIVKLTAQLEADEMVKLFKSSPNGFGSIGSSGLSIVSMFVTGKPFIDGNVSSSISSRSPGTSMELKGK